MSGPGRRFDPAELDGMTGPAPTDAEAAELLAVARELEDLARAEQVGTGVAFEDRVMAAVALAPRPHRRAAALGGVAGLFDRIGLAWRDLWGAGRPLAVRTQAFALLLIVAIAVDERDSAVAARRTRRGRPRGRRTACVARRG